jgi:hypothetical protein
MKTPEITENRDEKANLILDFELIDESIYIRFFNASNIEAIDVNVKFSQIIKGLRGTKNISGLNIFKKLNYFAPRKEFLIYVDEIDSFFVHLKNEIINIQIKYLTLSGKKTEKKITHHLGIYRDLPIIIKKCKI